MKMLLLMIVLLFPTLSHASPSLDLGKGYSIGLNTDFNFYTVAQRDWFNGMWLIGYGKDIAPLYRTYSDGTKKELLFLGVYNTFAVGDGRGVFGLDFGVHATAVADGLQGFVNSISGLKLDVIPQMPPWLQKIGQWTTFEVGAGYRVFGQPKSFDDQNIKRFCATVGGQVKVPFETLFNHQGSL